MCKNLPRANFSRGAGEICTFSEGFRVRSTVACRIPSVWCGAPDAASCTVCAGIFPLRRPIPARFGRAPSVRLCAARASGFRARCVQAVAPGLAGTSVRVRPYAYSTLMVFVLPLRPLMMPPVMMTLSPFSSCITFRLTCSAW